MKSIRNTILLVLSMFVLLTACTQMGLAPAQGLDEKIAYGYSVDAAVRTSAAQALNAGTINVADAKQVLVATDSARVVLDGASAASRYGDVPTAMQKLATATALLTQIQQYLQSKGVK
jgi:hypothetical protein